MPRPSSLALLALALATAPALAQAPGYAGLAGGAADPAAPRRLRVPDFDPVRDVPAMANWVPDTDFDGGAAHCYAMTILTYYAWRRIDFTPEAGLPAREWSDRTPADTPVALDEDGMHVVMEWAVRHPDRRVRVGGAADLRAYTAADTGSEELFRRVAEALQFAMQVPTNIGRYLRNMATASIDLLPGERYTLAGINRRAAGELAARLAAGKLAPFTAHPAEPRTDGHVLMAYALEEDAAAWTFTLYDPNAPPRGSTARPATLVVDKATGTYELRNHAGRPAYTGYRLLTPLKPDRAYERQVFRLIVTHVDEYLAINAWVFDRLAEAQRTGEALGEWKDEARRRFEDELVPRARERIDGVRRRTAALRRRLGF